MKLDKGTIFLMIGIGFVIGWSPAFVWVHEFGHYLMALLVGADAWWQDYYHVGFSTRWVFQDLLIYYAGPSTTMLVGAMFMRQTAKRGWYRTATIGWGVMWFEYLFTFIGADMGALVDRLGSINYFIWLVAAGIVLCYGAYQLTEERERDEHLAKTQRAGVGRNVRRPGQ